MSNQEQHDLHFLRDSADTLARFALELLTAVENIQSQLDSLHAVKPHIQQIRRQADAIKARCDEGIDSARWATRPQAGIWTPTPDAPAVTAQPAPAVPTEAPEMPTEEEAEVIIHE